MFICSPPVPQGPSRGPTIQCNAVLSGSCHRKWWIQKSGRFKQRGSLPPDLEASNCESREVANDKNCDNSAANLCQVEVRRSPAVETAFLLLLENFKRKFQLRLTVRHRDEVSQKPIAKFWQLVRLWNICLRYERASLLLFYKCGSQFFSIRELVDSSF